MIQALSNNLPTALVIFGASGDLASKKLVPAIFNLYQKKLLPEQFQVVGFSRRNWTTKKYRIKIQDILIKEHNMSKAEANDFSGLFSYASGYFDKSSGYKILADILRHHDREWHSCANKLFYLSIPPRYYETVFRQLARSGLAAKCGGKEEWTRVIVEKPFGRDSKTAQKLDTLLSKLFKEEQIYRIDHYLGKETVQNILAFRFSNPFLSPAWNKKSIKSIKIQLLEKNGVAGRAGFYDNLGALRDVGQNHLLQLLALFTMEAPMAFDAPSIRKERVKVLESLDIMTEKEVWALTARAQYRGYNRLKGVGKNSKTETYFRIQAGLNTSRFKGVPIFLESGKFLDKNLVEVVVEFKHPKPCLCPPDADKHYESVLRYQIQPQERISTSFWVKKPGRETILEEKDFTFDYRKSYPSSKFIDPYEKLILDVILGNQTLFVSTDEIMVGWKFIDSITSVWEQGDIKFKTYARGAKSIL